MNLKINKRIMRIIRSKVRVREDDHHNMYGYFTSTEIIILFNKYNLLTKDNVGLYIWIRNLVKDGLITSHWFYFNRIDELAKYIK